MHQICFISVFNPLKLKTELLQNVYVEICLFNILKKKRQVKILFFVISHYNN